jgi:hypothetical protein
MRLQLRRKDISEAIAKRQIVVREGEQGERKVELKEETVVCRLAVGLH